VIPAYNEEGAIGGVVERLRARHPWKEVLVVDDGSRDQTAAKAEAAGPGVAELWAEIQGFLDWSAPRRQGRRRGREDARLRDLLARRFLRHVDEALSDGAFARAVDAVVAREIDPYSAVADLMAQVLASPDGDRR
jgi:glycosyltransferase involved in cell wall biosynthesis